MNTTVSDIYWVMILIDKITDSTRRQLARRHYRPIVNDNNLIARYDSHDSAKQGVTDIKELLHDGDSVAFLLMTDQQFATMESAHGIN